MVGYGGWVGGGHRVWERWGRAGRHQGCLGTPALLVGVGTPAVQWVMQGLASRAGTMCADVPAQTTQSSQLTHQAWLGQQSPCPPHLWPSCCPLLAQRQRQSWVWAGSLAASQAALQSPACHRTAAPGAPCQERWAAGTPVRGARTQLWIPSQPRMHASAHTLGRAPLVRHEPRLRA